MPGTVINLEPGLRCVLAPNPSPMTFTGTNSFLLGTGEVAVIDPGPNVPYHLTALLDALDPGEHITHIFVTHSHRDHSPLARSLSQVTGAPILAFGTHEDGRSDIMRRLSAEGLVGGEGVDTAFRPDERLLDGDMVSFGDVALQAIWTPGHMSNHLCFAWGDRLFTGDHVMGWASSLVSPPDGDLTAFMASCRKIAPRGDRIYYPAHGKPILAPSDRLDWLIAHRLQRESQILTYLDQGPATVATITTDIYASSPPELLPAARRNVLAHLIDLVSRGHVVHVAPLTPGVLFRRQLETEPEISAIR